MRVGSFIQAPEVLVRYFAFSSVNYVMVTVWRQFSLMNIEAVIFFMIFVSIWTMKGVKKSLIIQHGIINKIVGQRDGF